jgi:hypothetical protein
MVGADHSTENRLEAAELRLAKAIGRLEAALENNRASEPTSARDVADEIKRLQTENDDLKDLIGQSSVRLEATIGTLKNQMMSQTEGRE